MKSIISIEESKRLISLEAVITKGLNNFIEVGEALLEIRDSRLYRIEHGTFETYCREKWGMSIRQAQRLIGGANVVSAIKETRPVGRVPETESQARPLTKLPAEDQPKAWAKAVEAADGKQPTAKQVDVAVGELVHKQISPVVPEMKTRLPKYIPAIAVGIADNAIRILQTIVVSDSTRVQALNKVIKYCKEELNK